MEVLILLVERRGQLVTRDDIAARLWGDGVFVDTDRNINSIVRKLRQALKDDPDHPEFLETVVGKGYRFVGPLEVVSSRTGTPQSHATAPAPFTSEPARGRLWAIGILACVAVAALVWFGWRTWRAPAVEAGPAHSLAILPLDNLSGDAAQDYFADGMTQELTTELAQVSELRVISHTSVLQYQNSRKSVPEIAKELHVDAVIEGSVLRSGNRVRVTAQLIRAPSDRAMWANSYERDLRDVLSLQRDIAEDIAAQVKIKLTRSSVPTGSPRALDPQAHDLYLQGLFHYEKNTEKDLQEAIGDFQKAIAKDSSYAAPYAGMADTYAELGIFYWPPPQAMPQAKAAALKALELDPNLSEAHVSLGSVYYFYEWDWAAAEREAQRSLALNRSNAYARDLLAAYYGTVGRFDDSLRELQQARDLAPRSAEILGDTVFWVFMSRNYDLAIANGQAVTAFEPDNAFAQVFLGMAYAKEGHVPEALQHADLARQYDDGPLIASFRANVYALAGRKSEAAAALREIEKQRVEHYSCAYEVGTGYILLGQTDRGFHWLNNAYEGRSECMILLKVDPRLDSVRSDPRYQGLLRRVGLAD
ncbi:MAG: winged helix-turn-helix domain-containing protein [Acidobacteriia bacterium]|nr:winged helix-turn-helix domain-containing protein [Terriglobia bacterium]